jgi:hypothetical protein
MATNKGNGNGTTRRGFLAACGAAAAATVLPIAVSAGGAGTPSRLLAPVSRWYEATVDEITRAWEQRFRHRQYRPDEEDGDWEDRASPRNELEEAVAAMPLLRDEATAHLILAVSAQENLDGGTPTGEAAQALALDLLEHADRLGYFGTPCPQHLRFPDLPVQNGSFDDFWEAERVIESARNCLALVSNAREGVFPAKRRAEERKRLEAAEQRLAAMRAGKVKAFTAAEKTERHEALRCKIVLAYRARLEAAGEDASWVEVPRYWRRKQLDAKEARS